MGALYCEKPDVWSKFVLTHRLYESWLLKGSRPERAIFQSLYGSPAFTSDIFPFHLHFILGLDKPVRFLDKWDMRRLRACNNFLLFIQVFRISFCNEVYVSPLVFRESLVIELLKGKHKSSEKIVLYNEYKSV